ncbi:isocitrate lyase/PEP mutase family protein [candidate division KSB1 bacterium]|nr:isocitrate lyase/PEP mutase family protein [candidate division KSB1 bacterium]
MGLRELLAAHEMLVAPGAYDALSALLIRQAGFPLVYVTGLGNEASDLGFPDLGFTTATELARRASCIAEAVGAPVVCDADTGFGGSLNIRRTVRLFEAGGVAAIHIEDQTFPKRCGVLAGKQVIPRETFASRIRAAADARRTEDFCLIARTDAKAWGLPEVIRRLNLYAESGADLAMLGDFYTLDEYRRIAREVKVPLVACASDPAHFAQQPDYTVDEMRAAGVRVLLYWYLPLFAAMKGVARALTALRANGAVAPTADDLCTYDDYARVTRLSEWLRLGGDPD